MRKRSKFARETVRIAGEAAANLGAQFVNEVERLVDSGGVNPEQHDRSSVFAVALETIASRYGGNRSSEDYKNLKHF